MTDHVLTSYIKLCYVNINFKRTNQSCWSSKISQSINVELRTCDRNGKQFFFQQKQEKLWSFDKAKNTLIKIKILRAVKKYSLLDFTEYVSFSEVQKNSQIVNV